MIGVEENHELAFRLLLDRPRVCRRSCALIRSACLNNCCIPSSSVNIPTVRFQSLSGSKGTDLLRPLFFGPRLLDEPFDISSSSFLCSDLCRGGRRLNSFQDFGRGLARAFALGILGAAQEEAAAAGAKLHGRAALRASLRDLDGRDRLRGRRPLERREIL